MKNEREKERKEEEEIEEGRREKGEEEQEEEKEKENLPPTQKTDHPLLWPGARFLSFTHKSLFSALVIFLCQIPRSKLLRQKHEHFLGLLKYVKTYYQVPILQLLWPGLW